MIRIGTTTDHGRLELKVSDGTQLPGPGTIYVDQSLHFQGAIGLGDTITVTLKVRDKIEQTHRVIFDCRAVNQKAEEVNFPERVYREKMTDQEGLLVIYILDSHYVFLQEEGKEKDAELKEIIDKEGLDLNIPLIGYAIGFPPIDPDPGGVYVHGNYGFEDEEAELEFNEADSELPADANEL